MISMACFPFPHPACLALVLASLALSPALPAAAQHMDHGAMAPAKKAVQGGITVARPWARASAGRAPVTPVRET